MVAAPVIAEFFGYSVLEPMLWVLLGLVIRTSSSVIAEKLLRDLQLATISKIFMVATVSSSLVSVIAALADLGAWALVIGSHRQPQCDHGGPIRRQPMAAELHIFVCRSYEATAFWRPHARG